MPVAPDLPEKYYLDNFHFVLSHVAHLYADIINEDERTFYDDFIGLSETAKCLYVRLLSRRGDWFRRDKLAYAEIPDITAAAVELQSQRFLEIYDLQSGGLPQEDDWLNLFTRQELATAIQTSIGQKVPRRCASKSC